jgi:hypothetical protein
VSVAELMPSARAASPVVMYLLIATALYLPCNV